MTHNYAPHQDVHRIYVETDTPVRIEQAGSKQALLSQWVREGVWSELDPPECKVLIVMLDAASPDLYCDLSVSEIGRRTGYSSRTSVKTILGKLRAAGVAVPRGRGGGTETTLYELRCPQRATRAAGKPVPPRCPGARPTPRRAWPPPRGGPENWPGSGIWPGQPGQKPGPVSSGAGGLRPVRTSSSLPIRANDDVDDVVALLIQQTFTEADARRLAAQYPAERIRDACRSTEWKAANGGFERSRRGYLVSLLKADAPLFAEVERADKARARSEEARQRRRERLQAIVTQRWTEEDERLLCAAWGEDLAAMPDSSRDVIAWLNVLPDDEIYRRMLDLARGVAGAGA